MGILNRPVGVAGLSSGKFVGHGGAGRASVTAKKHAERTYATVTLPDAINSPMIPTTPPPMSRNQPDTSFRTLKPNAR